MKMTNSAKKVDKAMREAKNHFAGCALCSAPRVWLQGCHIYPRSTYPKLRDLKYNIVGLCGYHHLLLDMDGHMKRKPLDRIDWLMEMADRTDTEKMLKLFKWLQLLRLEINERK